MRLAGMKLVAFLLLIASLAFAVTNFKLYLKDGSYQVVTEYHVEGDRVRFYSAERSQWEEIPVSLADLKRTDSQLKAEEQRVQEASRTVTEEKTEETALDKEVARVPADPGVYMAVKGQIKAIPEADSKVVNNKRRSILKAMSPIPMVSGKATVELAGLHAPTQIADTEPDFYIRLAQEERFGIIRLSEHKGARVAEKLTIIPVSNEVVEEPNLVKIFRRQVGEDLYQIGPLKSLEPGEYAVVEYTEGEMNMQIWDFGIAEAAQTPHSK